MFQFAWPYMAFLFFLPFIFWWTFPASRTKDGEDTPTILFPSISRAQSAFNRNKPSYKRHLSAFPLLIYGIWVLLVLALMRPQIINQFQYIQNEGYDILLAVDISPSMNALDFSTETETLTRLDITKDVVGDFIQKRYGDRVGLILFGEFPYLRVPLTLDVLSIKHILNNTFPGMAGESTSIGSAIVLAIRNLRDRPTKSRVLILLTDGQDTSSILKPLQTAQMAKEYGIRIYTIAVGKKEVTPYIDENGQTVMVKMAVDKALLQKIATITDGKFFVASDSKSLQKIYNTIDKLERTKAEAGQYLIRKPLYRYPLGFGCVLLLIVCLRPVYRKVRFGA